MRIRTLATCLLLSLASAACTGELTDDPGLPDGDGSGDGSGSGSGSGSNTGEGTFTVSVDKPTIATERFSTHTIAVTVQGSGGFQGDIALTASIVDANGTAVPGWTATLAAPTASIATDGTAVVNVDVKIPSTGALVGNLKIAAVSGTINQSATSAITAENIITVRVTNDGNTCSYPDGAPGDTAAIQAPVGSKVRFKNMSAAGVIIHSGGAIPHQPISDADRLAMGEFYEFTMRAQNLDQSADWYCHDINGVGKNPPPQTLRPRIRVVAP
jgi:hypothetical protein